MNSAYDAIPIKISWTFPEANALRGYLDISIRSAINDAAEKIKAQMTELHVKRWIRDKF